MGPLQMRFVWYWSFAGVSNLTKTILIQLKNPGYFNSLYFNWPSSFFLLQMFHPLSEHQHPVILSVTDGRSRGVHGLGGDGRLPGEAVPGHGHEAADHQHSTPGNFESASRRIAAVANGNNQVLLTMTGWSIGLLVRLCQRLIFGSLGSSPYQVRFVAQVSNVP